jgi:hypothetical protein
MGNVKNVMFLFPVMGYYLFESVIASFFIYFAWRIFLEPLTKLPITYLQWVTFIWIVKVIFFDVFKLITGLNNINTNEEGNNG